MIEGTGRDTRVGGLVAKAGVLSVSLALVLCLPATASARDDRIFTIGNYPVQARAGDAVAAKEKAIAEGQRAAFRSLLKRLVPVTAYKHLSALKDASAADLVESVAVRSERNSSTDYIASYDFAFSPEPVRRLLDQRGIPYLDRQAPVVTIVPAYRIGPEVAGRLPQTFAYPNGSDAWLYAWKALDLANSLTPVSLQPLKREVHADTIRLLAEGDFSQLRTLGQAYQTETIVLAVLEPEADQKKLSVVLSGRDAVQNLYLKRKYRMEDLDLAYTAELAAVISLAIIEGRWKAINVRDGTPSVGLAASESLRVPGGFDSARDAGGAVTIAVAFHGMQEWQEISRRLASTPAVAGLEVLGLSARRARVSLSYPGGPESLAVTLAQQGLRLESTQEGWLLMRQ